MKLKNLKERNGENNKMLKITQEINSGDDLREAFRQYGRIDQFSYHGYDALYLLLNYDEDQDQDQEIDVIGICCDFSEEPLADVLKSYSLESFSDLVGNTLALMVDDETVIYQAY